MRIKRVVIVLVVLAVVLVGGPWVYFNVIQDDAPEKLTLEADDTGTTGDDSAPADITGTWTATRGSQAGYRVNEVLLGQTNAAVGRTTDITGTLVVEGTTVKTASVEVDMTTVTSDEDRRDNQFKGRIMEVDQFPTATFELVEPITLDSVPPAGTVITEQAVGDLTLHGTTKRVTFELKAKRSGATIEVNGSIPITFADYGIDDPSFGDFVKTEDHGELEFLVVYARA